MSLDLILFAANTAANASSAHQANKFTRLGNQVQQNQLNNRLQEEQLASTQDALASAKELREALGANAALYGMRGQAPGIGSALAVQNENLSNYYSDQNTRDLNLRFKKNEAKLQGSLANLNSKASINAKHMDAFSKTLDSASFNTLRRGSYTGKRELAPVETAKPSWSRSQPTLRKSWGY